MRSRATLVSICILATLAISQTAVLGANIVIITNQGAVPGLNELGAAFTRASGNQVTVILAEGDALEQRLANGTVDLVSQNPEPMEKLVKSGKIVASTVTPFQLAELGVAVKAGAPKPDISTAQAYRSALLAAKSIGYSRGCSGTNIGAGIAQLGLTEQLKAKTVFTTMGPVTDYLARGDFEIGLQQSNIMAGVPGVDYVGPRACASEQTVPIECRSGDKREGAGRRARDDPVHGFAGRRAATAQDTRTAVQTINRLGNGGSPWGKAWGFLRSRWSV